MRLMSEHTAERVAMTFMLTVAIVVGVTCAVLYVNALIFYTWNTLIATVVVGTIATVAWRVAGKVMQS